MLAARVDKKKIFEYGAILGIIFLIMGYVIFTNFIIKPGSRVEKTIDTAIKVTPVKTVGELEVEVIKNDKFKNLQENTYVEVDLESLQVGKKDPFEERGQ